MSNRYELPDPKCRHAKPSMRVTAGDLSDPTGPHASVWVCHRPGCIADARDWAFAMTRMEPTITVRDLMRELEDSLGRSGGRDR